MEYNATKYYKGTKEMNSASDLLSDIYQACRNKWTSWGSNFEYKKDLDNIIDDIFMASSNSTAICNTIEMGRYNISTLDSQFSADYYEASNLDFQEMNSSEQEEMGYLIEYTNKELARELKRHAENSHETEMSDKALDAYFMLNDENYWKLTAEEKILKIQNFNYQLEEYENMSEWDKLRYNTEVFIVSTAEGALNVVEQVVDGAAMLGTKANVTKGKCISFTLDKLSDLSDTIGFDNVSKILDKSKDVIDKTTMYYQETMSNAIEYDWTGALYDAYIDARGINSYIAYGGAHSAGQLVGDIAANLALQFVPGGTLVTAGLHGLKAMGKTAEKDLSKDVDFNKAFWHSTLDGLIEGGAAYFLYSKGKSISTIKHGDTVVKNGVSPIKYLANKLSPKIFKDGVQVAVKEKQYEFYMKIGNAILKEYAKEGTSLIVAEEGEKYDFWGATKNASVAAVTQIINEKFVAKWVDKFTKGNIASKDTKLKQAEYKRDLAQKGINKTEQEIKKITELAKTTSKAKDFNNDINSIVKTPNILSENSNSSFDNMLVNLNDKLSKYMNIKESAISEVIIAEGNYTKLDYILKENKIVSTLVNNGYVNKYVKKLSSKAIDFIDGNKGKVQEFLGEHIEISSNKNLDFI